MKGFTRIFSIFLIIAFIAVSGNTEIFAQDAKADQPVLLTSCGQSPGPLKIKISLQRLKYDFKYNLQASVNDLDEKDYKTIIIVTGASLKGMGAAGVSIDDELERISALIKEAKSRGIKIIGAHVEGMARRAQGASEGDNTDEQSIDCVCPNSDMLFIQKEGDQDKRFTLISNSKNIPLVVFEKNREIPEALKKIFEK
ncbi:MAG: hypothetical protein GY863_15365 [bacterium]|nr:hypothetical protein [bacterium]